MRGLMSRRRRILANVLTILSLLLFLAGIALRWVVTRERDGWQYEWRYILGGNELTGWKREVVVWSREWYTQFAILPIMWAITGIASWWLRDQGEWRRFHGRCVACGYDLRATPRRCPECGQIPPGVSPPPPP
jgi:hypothetical protein